MKIKSDNFEEYIQKNFNSTRIIFFYGSNLGLIDLLYNKSITLLNVDVHNPFSVSRIDGTEFKENPFILEDNINTLNIFSEKKIILLDLSLIKINKNIEDIILNAIVVKDINYLLIIKAGNIGEQNQLVKYLKNSDNSILTVCYEEKTNKIKNDINNILVKHNISFSSEFISNFSFTFNSDTLSNKMELDKLDIFLTNNNTVTEEVLFKFLINNENINLDRVVKSCSKGDAKKSLFYLDKIYDKSNSNVILVRMFGKHFKIIEKILISSKLGSSFSEAIECLKPPVFFKDKPFFLSQCNLWSFKKINLIQKRLIDLELKTKRGLYPEKTLISQFILSTSVLANKKVKT